MWRKIRPQAGIILLTLFVMAWFFVPGQIWAQDDVEQDETEEGEAPELVEPKGQIVITGNDVTSPPSIILHVYGRDAAGNPIDFNADPLRITHNGLAVLASTDETYPGGTFTIFLIDIPTGVSDQLPAIQEAIQSFAAPGSGMQEQVDHIAIYQVGETEVQPLLAPANFYNSVDNFFVDDLTPEIGSTALRDSIASMLDQVESLKPESTIPVSLIVMSDGTDAVSEGNELNELTSRAAELNVPIHTVWVSSTDITIDGQQLGQAFLQDLAAGAQGKATFLDDQAGLAELWAHIAGFRNQTKVRYVVDGLTGGLYDVNLSLTSDPEVTGEMTVDVPENQPQVFIDLPVGSDTISLPSLEEPVPLRLGATVSWLDGEQRELDTVLLRVNNQDLAEIPVEQIEDFTIEIGNLRYGENAIELLVTDDQGLRATNLPVYINIVEGPEEIPPELQPGGSLGRTILDIFLVIVVIGILVGIGFWLFRSGRLAALGVGSKSRRKRKKDITYTTDEPFKEPEGMAASNAYMGQANLYGYLEVLDSITDVTGPIELRGQTISIGRSSSQSDVAFKEDLTVSRKHASLALEGNHYRIFDENSTSGTWVNGRQVPEYGVELVDGDEIHLGAVHLIYRFAV